MNWQSRKILAKETFVEILKKTIGEIPDDVEEIYSHFYHFFKSYGRNLDQQVLFLSSCIFESKGFQSKEEEDPTRNPGESDDEYLERLKYKGRGYLRLVGKDVYRASFGVLVSDFGDMVKNPNIVSNSIKNSVAFSFWLWSKFVNGKLGAHWMRELESNSYEQIMISIRALNRDLTGDQFNQRLEMYEIAQEVVRKAECREQDCKSDRDLANYATAETTRLEMSETARALREKIDDEVKTETQIQPPRVETSSILAPRTSNHPTASLRQRKHGLTEDEYLFSNLGQS